MSSLFNSDIIFPDMSFIVPEVHKKFNLRYYTKDEILYHYTSIEGFMSILQNRDFWISNIRFMNDAKEFENGCEICREILQEKIIDLGKNLDDLQKKHEAYYKGLLNICNGNKSGGIFPIISTDIFALSLCEDGDLLTQWQVYGQGGVSIGFKNRFASIENGIALMNEDQYNEELKTIDPNQMMPHNELRFYTQNVIYDNQVKRDLIEFVLKCGIDFINKFPQDDVDMAIEGISDTLFYYFALMKDCHFAHEREKRFLIISNDDDSRIHFRSRNGVIVPFLKMKILDLNCRPHIEFPVEEIVIAPGSKQSYVADSMKYFLEKIQMKNLVNKIRLSDIPYRE